jgi:hypothetical protein
MAARQQRPRHRRTEKACGAGNQADFLHFPAPLSLLFFAAYL